MKIANAESASSQGLWKPWQTPSSALRFGVAHAAVVTALWFLFARFDLQRLLQHSGLALLMCWLGVLAFHQLFWALGKQPLLRDPGLGVCVIAVLVACLSIMALYGFVIRSTPHWRMFAGDAAANRAAWHPFSGLSNAMNWILWTLPIWFVGADMRLSALDSRRDARLRARGVVGAMAWPAAAYAKISRLLSGAGPISGSSYLLEPYTLSRVLLRPLADLALLMLVMFALALANTEAAGQLNRVYANVVKVTNTFPTGLWQFCFWLTFAASGLFLGLARRIAWLKHSYSACVILVFGAHFLAAAIIVTLLTEAPKSDAPAWVKAAFVALNLVLAITELIRLSKRSDQIELAARLQAEQATVNAQTQRVAALSDLRSLQAQIEPHFLYNTLSNVQLLIRQDSAKADAMTGHLIDYLRARLPLMRMAQTPLAVELDLVRSYLEILKMRMGERLHVTWAISDDCLQLPTLPLSLMSLVENAVKHGLEPKPGGASMHISASVDKGWATVTVADTGVGFDAAQTNKAAGTGLGLSNLQERLRLSYADVRDSAGELAGKLACVSLTHNEPSGVVASIHWPVTSSQNP